MKKSLFIFLAFISITSFNAAGQPKLTEKEVKDMLCHKWKLVSMEVDGELLPPDEEVYITFLANGTFTDSEKINNKPEKKWTYNHSTMTLTTGDVPKKILKIDDKHIEFKSQMDGEIIIVILERVEKKTN